MAKWVNIREFSSRAEAEVARSFLDANGISARIEADDVGGMRPQLAFSGGARLLVEEEDAAQAERLLRAQVKK